MRTRSLRYRDSVYSAGADALGLMAEAIWKGKPARWIYDSLASRISAIAELNGDESRFFMKGCVAIWRTVRGSGPKRDRESAYMAAMSGEQDMRRICASLCLEVSSRLGKEAADRASSDPEGPAIFVVSRHPNCADGHIPLEGKLLLAEDWESKVGDPERIAAVRGLGLMTVKKAMEAPWYLFVRPYCRHRLIPVQVEDALNGKLPDIDDPKDSGEGSRARRRRAYSGFLFAERVNRKSPCRSGRAQVRRKRKEYVSELKRKR